MSCTAFAADSYTNLSGFSLFDSGKYLREEITVADAAVCDEKLGTPETERYLLTFPCEGVPVLGEDLFGDCIGFCFVVGAGGEGELIAAYAEDEHILAGSLTDTAQGFADSGISGFAGDIVYGDKSVDVETDDVSASAAGEIVV